MRPRICRLGLLLAALLVTSCAASAAEPARATLQFNEFAFVPSTLEIPAGRQISLTVTNDGVVDHDLVVAELGGQLVRLRAHTRTTLMLRPLSPGTYRMLCSIPTHSELGMVGALIAR